MPGRARHARSPATFGKDRTRPSEHPCGCSVRICRIGRPGAAGGKQGAQPMRNLDTGVRANTRNPWRLHNSVAVYANALWPRRRREYIRGLTPAGTSSARLRMMPSSAEVKLHSAAICGAGGRSMLQAVRWCAGQAAFANVASACDLIAPSRTSAHRSSASRISSLRSDRSYTRVTPRNPFGLCARMRAIAASRMPASPMPVAAPQRLQVALGSRPIQAMHENKSRSPPTEATIPGTHSPSAFQSPSANCCNRLDCWSGTAQPPSSRSDTP